MNILLINHYAGSPEMGMEFRPFYLSREWVKQGHNVSIIAADFSHLRKTNPTVEKELQQECIDGVNYFWLKTRSYNKNGIGRFLNIFDFVKKLYRNRNKITEMCKPDIVIASSTYPYDNFVAHKIAKKAKAKHIYEVHDLWPLSPIELNGYSKRHPFIILTQYLEDYSYRKADKVVSLLPEAKKYMMSRGMAEDKFEYIPNGILKDDWIDYNETLPKEHSDKFKELKANNKLIVGYAGSHGIAYALDSFLDAAKLLSNDTDVHFVLVGSGLEKDDLVSRYGHLKNVTFLSPVEKGSIPALLKSFDICYLGLKRLPIFRFGISPNKLMDYMMASKPIICAIESGNDIVGDCKCGLTIEPENPKAIVEAIIKLKNTSAEVISEMGANGNSFIMENSEYEILSRKFLKEINN